MDTITAALCETCPEADRAAWPSGLMCAKAQGADFALTASTFDFSAILQESLDSLPGKETADAEAPFLLPYATGEEPAQDGPDNNLKMQTDGSGNNEARRHSLFCVLSRCLWKCRSVFSRRKKIRCGAVGGSVSSRPGLPAKRCRDGLPD